MTQRRSGPLQPRRRRPAARAGSGLEAADLALGAGAAVVLAIEGFRRVRSAVARLPESRIALLAVAGAALIGVIGLGAVLFRRGGQKGAPRERRSSVASAPPSAEGWAAKRDLSRLLVKSPPGDRVVLGSLGRSLVAAEARQSVLVVGPSQSGKTTSLALPAISGWDGPVLATSVKTDLVRESIEGRRALGEVAVFDPTGVTGLRPAGWSPLSGAATWAGARRVADSLCSLGRKDGGIEDAGYWYASAERLLAPLLRAAALSGGSMSDVLRWLDDQSAPEPLLALQMGNEREAARVAQSFLALEERQRSSVYSTAQTVLAAYGDPEVAASERLANAISPGWLLEHRAGPAGGHRTLYCCAPSRDQARLSPVFVALVRQVLDGAFDASSRTGEPLDPPLLVLLDEAANVAPLPDLDQVLSTAAGHGICLVTVWQDLAQAEARYGERWATIVNNHRGKVVFPGVADPRTLELLSALIGDVESAQLSTSRTGEGTWSETESRLRVPVAPAGWIRRLPERHCLVVYGGLPPALVSAGRPPAGIGEGVRTRNRPGGWATRAVAQRFRTSDE